MVNKISMRHGRKAQAATEYLLTYGWAILAVLVGIGALAYFGVIGGDTFMQDKCIITGGFSCGQNKISGNMVQISVKNNLGTDLATAAITVHGTSGGSCNATHNVSGLLNDEGTGLQTYNCTITGQKFKGDIIITYTKANEEVSHTVTGSIAGKVES